MADVRDRHLHILHRLDMVKGTDMTDKFYSKAGGAYIDLDDPDYLFSVQQRKQAMVLKNHIDMKPIQHRLDEARRKLEAAKPLAADQVRAMFAAKDAAAKPRPRGQEQEPLTRARLIAAVEQIKFICEAHAHTDSAKVDLIHGLARQLVSQWDNEDE
jgi:hypothetical protein